MGLARAQPNWGQAWAFCFITWTGLKHFISARLIDGAGLDSVQSPKHGLPRFRKYK